MRKNVRGVSARGTAVDAYIGRRIKFARENIGEHPGIVAAALGITESHYLTLEAGSSRITAELIASVAAFFKRDIAWFFEGMGSDLTTSAPQQGDARLFDLARERLSRRPGQSEE